MLFCDTKVVYVGVLCETCLSLEECFETIFVSESLKIFMKSNIYHWLLTSTGLSDWLGTDICDICDKWTLVTLTDLEDNATL